MNLNIKYTNRILVLISTTVSNLLYDHDSVGHAGALNPICVVVVQDVNRMSERQQDKRTKRQNSKAAKEDKRQNSMAAKQDIKNNKTNRQNSMAAKEPALVMLYVYLL